MFRFTVSEESYPSLIDFSLGGCSCMSWSCGGAYVSFRLVARSTLELPSVAFGFPWTWHCKCLYVLT